MRNVLLLCLRWTLAVPASAQTPADLLVTGSSILDVRTGPVLRDRSIVIRAGQIDAVLVAGQSLLPSSDPIDAMGQLVTGGLIDVHEVGRRANLVIWNADRLDGSQNLWAGRTVIKTV